eukprot:220037-Rhodomonas_salina.2
MGYKQDVPTPVAEDNVACIYMSKSSAMFHKGKHIDVTVQVYHLREFVQDGIMELYHVSTHQQAADSGADDIAARIPGSRVTKVNLSVEEPFSLHAEVKENE